MEKLPDIVNLEDECSEDEEIFETNEEEDGSDVVVLSDESECNEDCSELLCDDNMLKEDFDNFISDEVISDDYLMKESKYVNSTLNSNSHIITDSLLEIKNSSNSEHEDSLGLCDKLNNSNENLPETDGEIAEIPVTNFNCALTNEQSSKSNFVNSSQSMSVSQKSVNKNINNEKNIIEVGDCNKTIKVGDCSKAIQVDSAVTKVSNSNVPIDKSEIIAVSADGHPVNETLTNSSNFDSLSTNNSSETNLSSENSSLINKVIQDSDKMDFSLSNSEIAGEYRDSCPAVVLKASSVTMGKNTKASSATVLVNSTEDFEILTNKDIKDTKISLGKNDVFSETIKYSDSTEELKHIKSTLQIESGRNEECSVADENTVSETPLESSQCSKLNLINNACSESAVDSKITSVKNTTAVLNMNTACSEVEAEKDIICPEPELERDKICLETSGIKDSDTLLVNNIKNCKVILENSTDELESLFENSTTDAESVLDSSALGSESLNHSLTEITVEGKRKFINEGKFLNSIPNSKKFRTRNRSDQSDIDKPLTRTKITNVKNKFKIAVIFVDKAKEVIERIREPIRTHIDESSLQDSIHNTSTSIHNTSTNISEMSENVTSISDDLKEKFVKSTKEMLYLNSQSCYSNKDAESKSKNKSSIKNKLLEDCIKFYSDTVSRLNRDTTDSLKVEQLILAKTKKVKKIKKRVEKVTEIKKKCLDKPVLNQKKKVVYVEKQRLLRNREKLITNESKTNSAFSSENSLLKVSIPNLKDINNAISLSMKSIKDQGPSNHSKSPEKKKVLHNEKASNDDNMLNTIQASCSHSETNNKVEKIATDNLNMQDNLELSARKIQKESQNKKPLISIDSISKNGVKKTIKKNFKDKKELESTNTENKNESIINLKNKKECTNKNKDNNECKIINPEDNKEPLENVCPVLPEVVQSMNMNNNSSPLNSCIEETSDISTNVNTEKNEINRENISDILINNRDEENVTSDYTNINNQREKRRSMKLNIVLKQEVQQKCCGHWFPNNKRFLHHLIENTKNELDSLHAAKLIDMNMQKCNICSIWLNNINMKKHNKIHHNDVESFASNDSLIPISDDISMEIKTEDTVTVPQASKLDDTPLEYLHRSQKPCPKSKKINFSPDDPHQRIKCNLNQKKSNAFKSLVLMSSLNDLPHYLKPSIILRRCKIKLKKKIRRKKKQITPRYIDLLNEGTDDSSQILEKKKHESNINKVIDKKETNFEKKIKIDSNSSRKSNEMEKVDESDISTDFINSHEKEIEITESHEKETEMVKVNKVTGKIKKVPRNYIKKKPSHKKILKASPTISKPLLESQTETVNDTTPSINFETPTVKCKEPLKSRRLSIDSKIKKSVKFKEFRNSLDDLHGTKMKEFRAKKRGRGRPRKIRCGFLSSESSNENSDSESSSDFEDENHFSEEIRENEVIPTVELNLFTLSSINEDVSIFLIDPKNPNFKVMASMDAIFVGDSALNDVTNQMSYVSDDHNVVYISPNHFLFPEIRDSEDVPLLEGKSSGNSLPIVKSKNILINSAKWKANKKAVEEISTSNNKDKENSCSNKPINKKKIGNKGLKEDEIILNNLKLNVSKEISSPVKVKVSKEISSVKLKVSKEISSPVKLNVSKEISSPVKLNVSKEISSPVKLKVSKEISSVKLNVSKEISSPVKLKVSKKISSPVKLKVSKEISLPINFSVDFQQEISRETSRIVDKDNITSKKKFVRAKKKAVNLNENKTIKILNNKSATVENLRSESVVHKDSIQNGGECNSKSKLDSKVIVIKTSTRNNIKKPDSLQSDCNNTATVTISTNRKKTLVNGLPLDVVRLNTLKQEESSVTKLLLDSSISEKKDSENVSYKILADSKNPIIPKNFNFPVLHSVGTGVGNSQKNILKDVFLSKSKRSIEEEPVKINSTTSLPLNHSSKILPCTDPVVISEQCFSPVQISTDTQVVVATAKILPTEEQIDSGICLEEIIRDPDCLLVPANGDENTSKSSTKVPKSTVDSEIDENNLLDFFDCNLDMPDLLESALLSSDIIPEKSKLSMYPNLQSEIDYVKPNSELSKDNFIVNQESKSINMSSPNSKKSEFKNCRIPEKTSIIQTDHKSLVKKSEVLEISSDSNDTTDISDAEVDECRETPSESQFISPFDFKAVVQGQNLWNTPLICLSTSSPCPSSVENCVTSKISQKFHESEGQSFDTTSNLSSVDKNVQPLASSSKEHSEEVVSKPYIKENSSLSSNKKMNSPSKSLERNPISNAPSEYNETKAPKNKGNKTIELKMLFKSPKKSVTKTYSKSANALTIAPNVIPNISSKSPNAVSKIAKSPNLTKISLKSPKTLSKIPAKYPNYLNKISSKSSKGLSKISAKSPNYINKINTLRKISSKFSKTKMKTALKSPRSVKITSSKLPKSVTKTNSKSSKVETLKRPVKSMETKELMLNVDNNIFITPEKASTKNKPNIQDRSPKITKNYTTPAKNLLNEKADISKDNNIDSVKSSPLNTSTEEDSGEISSEKSICSKKFVTPSVVSRSSDSLKMRICVKDFSQDIFVDKDYVHRHKKKKKHSKKKRERRIERFQKMSSELFADYRIKTESTSEDSFCDVKSVEIPVKIKVEDDICSVDSKKENDEISDVDFDKSTNIGSGREDLSPISIPIVVKHFDSSIVPIATNNFGNSTELSNQVKTSNHPNEILETIKVEEKSLEETNEFSPSMDNVKEVDSTSHSKSPLVDDRSWHSRGSKLKAKIMITDQQKGITNSFVGDDLKSPTSFSSPSSSKSRRKSNSIKTKDIRTYFTPTKPDELQSLASPSNEISTQSSVNRHSYRSPPFVSPDRLQNDPSKFKPGSGTKSNIPLKKIKRKHSTNKDIRQFFTGDKTSEDVDEVSQPKKIKIEVEEIDFEGFKDDLNNYSGNKSKLLQEYVDVLQMSRWFGCNRFPFPVDQLCDWDDDQLNITLFEKG